MLLLYDDPGGFEGLSPEEMQRIIEKYRAWSARLSEAGKLVASDKLTDGEGRVLRRKGGEVRVLDGPYSETKEVIGGYFLLHADDFDEAVRLAEDCPHLEFGGTLEVRAVDKME
jgi:hypothetical protein